MKFILLFLASFLSAQTLTFSLTTGAYGYSITCGQPTVEITTSSSYSGTVSYSWSGGTLTSPVVANSVGISSPGSYSVVASSGTDTATQSFVVVTNTTTPISTGSQTFLVTSAGPQSFTFATVSPTSNVTHYIYSPFGGTYTAGSSSGFYIPGAPGLYHYCMINNENGCSTTCIPTNVIGSPSNYVGINEWEQATLRLFPNPSQGLYTLIIKSGQKIKVEVYSSIGTLVSQKEADVEDIVIIDIREKQSGIYLLRLTDNYGKVQYLKLLKE
jgi:hypothetical protein